MQGAGRQVLADFAEEFPQCWLCGATWPLEIHHIARGCHREGGRYVRANLIRACSACHRGKLDAMPIARQLAIKQLWDEENYDRQAVNLLRGRQPDALTPADVQAGKEMT